MLFVLGGDGTHAGALAIHNEVQIEFLSCIQFSIHHTCTKRHIYFITMFSLLNMSNFA